jgi:hypothetical protein
VNKCNELGICQSINCDECDLKDKDLANKIVHGLQTINWYGNHSAKIQYIESMAHTGVRRYKKVNRFLTALNVVQLVEERLNGKQ